MSGAVKAPTTKVEVFTIMRALDPEVFDAVWAAIEAIIPLVVDEHPLVPPVPLAGPGLFRGVSWTPTWTPSLPHCTRGSMTL